jgi:hypothetical protein
MDSICEQSVAENGSRCGYVLSRCLERKSGTYDCHTVFQLAISAQVNGLARAAMEGRLDILTAVFEAASTKTLIHPNSMENR